MLCACGMRCSFLRSFECGWVGGLRKKERKTEAATAASGACHFASGVPKTSLKLSLSLLLSLSLTKKSAKNDFKEFVSFFSLSIEIKTWIMSEFDSRG